MVAKQARFALVVGHILPRDCTLKSVESTGVTHGFVRNVMICGWQRTDLGKCSYRNDEKG